MRIDDCLNLTAWQGNTNSLNAHQSGRKPKWVQALFSVSEPFLELALV
jgi:hypothetical protein